MVNTLLKISMKRTKTVKLFTADTSHDEQALAKEVNEYLITKNENTNAN